MRGFLKKKKRGHSLGKEACGGHKEENMEGLGFDVNFPFLVFSGVSFSMAGCGLLIIISHL